MEQPAHLQNAVATFYDASGAVVCVASFGLGTAGDGQVSFPVTVVHAAAGGLPVRGELATGAGGPVEVSITGPGGGGRFETPLPFGDTVSFEPVVFTDAELEALPVPVAYIGEVEAWL